MTPQAAHPKEDNTVQQSMMLVRAHNIDRYLAALFLPSKSRSAIFALFAFDAEICNIPNLVKEPMMGEIRLQWWRELIAGKRAGEAEGHPVAAPLLAAIKQYKLPLTAFDNYLQARVFDLYNDPMPDTGTFEGYAGETASTMFQLATIVIDGEGDSHSVAQTAGHAGVAWAIIDLLKKLPHHRAHQQCFIPADVMAQAGVSLEDYLSGEDKVKMAQLITLMSELAHHHLTRFDKALASLPQSGRPAFLAMCLMSSYLAQIKKRGVRILNEPLDVAQWRKQIYLWRASKNGKF